jgi:hypothetical protein
VPAASNALREAQARRVREIYDGLRREGVEHVLIAGDFNDTPDSVPLAPLLANGSDLKDISTRTLMTAAVLAPTPTAPKGTKSITY